MKLLVLVLSIHADIDRNYHGKDNRDTYTQLEHGRGHPTHRTYDTLRPIRTLADVTQEDSCARQRRFPEVSPFLDKWRRDVGPVVTNFVRPVPPRVENQLGGEGNGGCLLLEEDEGLLSGKSTTDVVRCHLIEQWSEERRRFRHALREQSCQFSSDARR
jgi:hypothetical protein